MDFQLGTLIVTTETGIVASVYESLNIVQQGAGIMFYILYIVGQVSPLWPSLKPK